MSEPIFYYVLDSARDRAAIDEWCKQQFQINGKRYWLDGDRIDSEATFYDEFEEKISTVSGFGRNLMAFESELMGLDAFHEDGTQHLVVWTKPERLMRGNPQFFREILDSMVGTAKGSWIEDEDTKGKTGIDWAPVNVYLVLACETARDADEIATRSKELQETWTIPRETHPQRESIP